MDFFPIPLPFLVDIPPLNSLIGFILVGSSISEKKYFHHINDLLSMLVLIRISLQLNLLFIDSDITKVIYWTYVPVIAPMNVEGG